MDSKEKGFYKNVIRRHIQALDANDYICVCGYKQASIDRFFDLYNELNISVNYGTIQLSNDSNGNPKLLRSDELPICVAGKTIVFLCDEQLNLVLDGHKATKNFKDLGAIVVSCFCRNLFYEKPINIGESTYEGIFHRANCVTKEGGGDYLEFGVFDGRTMSLAYHSMKEQKYMRFIGFDTFSGISGKLPGESNLYSDGNYYSNIETFNHNIRVANMEISRVFCHKGDILDTKHMEIYKCIKDIRKAAVVHIDCDIYRPAKAALDFCKDLLRQGSILLFDEFHANYADNDLGERRALNEWLEENPDISVERYCDYAAVARAFIVHVNKREK